MGASRRHHDRQRRAQSPVRRSRWNSKDVPERQALDIVLRGVSGYVARGARAGRTGASTFDRIMILPTSVAPRNRRRHAPRRPPAAPGAGRSGPIAPRHGRRSRTCHDDARRAAGERWRSAGATRADSASGRRHPDARSRERRQSPSRHRTTSRRSTPAPVVVTPGTIRSACRRAVRAPRRDHACAAATRRASSPAQRLVPRPLGLICVVHVRNRSLPSRRSPRRRHAVSTHARRRRGRSARVFAGTGSIAAIRTTRPDSRASGSRAKVRRSSATTRRCPFACR